MKKICKYYDCGWCYAPEEITNNSRNGGCYEPNECPYFSGLENFQEKRKMEKDEN